MTATWESIVQLARQGEPLPALDRTDSQELLGECMVDSWWVYHRGLKPLIGDVDPCLRYDGLEAMIRIALMVYARGDAEEAPPCSFKDWNMKSHY